MWEGKNDFSKVNRYCNTTKSERIHEVLEKLINSIEIKMNKTKRPRMPKNSKTNNNN